MKAYIISAPEPEKCKHKYPKLAYLTKGSDMIIENGVWRMKRKYGKFTRQAVKLENDATI